MKKLEIIISGRVQGVGYRYFTVHAAREFNILGNTRNTTDGKVLVIAVGNDSNMNLFIQELRSGPRMAIVDEIKTTELSAVQNFSNFRIEY
ncbi:acylphosphatase [Candidatus Cloacimonadota bacterium]